MMETVLIVEDDEATAFALRDGFEYEGFSVFVAADGRRALDMATQEDPDVIILDLMLPELSGIDVCKRMRADGNDTPIIMLTARGQEADKVLGLTLGADDYITKPFGFSELLARVRAVLRRSLRSDKYSDCYEFGDVWLDFKSLEATKSGRPIALSPFEFKLLRFLVEHRQRIVTREQLLNAVWEYRILPFTRTVDVHIGKLRKKIEDNPNDPKYIVTLYGVGYKFLG